MRPFEVHKHSTGIPDSGEPTRVQCLDRQDTGDIMAVIVEVALTVELATVVVVVLLEDTADI